ncbi:MAG: hypothetical protein JST88_02025 [Bacteroidetes bacterium]|nr:hypothetical protein [Bacteroidota bacterium]
MDEMIKVPEIISDVEDNQILAAFDQAGYPKRIACFYFLTFISLQFDQASIYLCWVKRTIAIFFISVYLFSTTQMAELLKLPVLIQHFIEHQQEDHSISLLEFLEMHYGQPQPHDNDYARDMQLPFKVPVHSALAYMAYTVPNLMPLTVKSVFFEETHAVTLHHSGEYSFRYLSLIWQPPRC